MQRSLLRKLFSKEAGQALPLLGLFLMVLIGFVALSIDVGRYVWARTSMQAGVDAAALAAAQSMPSQTDAAAKATEYWLDNSGFIQAQGNDISFEVTYPAGNKAIAVRGEADIPTWFAKFFGVDEWNVWAEGEAESQVLDISIVFDISGSMCFDSFYRTESNSTVVMGPGLNSPAGGFARPVLANAINSTTTTIVLNDAGKFKSTSAATNRSNFGTSWNSTTPYWQRTIGSTRTGMIAIDNELMRITNIVGNTLTVERARSNNSLGGTPPNVSHAAGAQVWHLSTGYSDTDSYCQLAGRFTPSATVNAPAQPFDGSIDAAKYFTTLFDPAYDKIGAASYSYDASIEENLTGAFGNVRSALDNIFYPRGNTNIAHGLAVGRQILDGSGKRANAVRVLVLLTDGIPNMVCGSTTYNQANYNTSNGCSDISGTSTQAANHAYSEAIRAANGDIVIYVIGLGNDVNSSFLKRVADGGVNGVGPCQDNEPNCRYYFAPTTAQLDEAFEAIAEATHIALVR